MINASLDKKLDVKQAAILESAQQAFVTYGFRKTSMDDIARGAGISRPALYLHYKNKDDIYRTLISLYYDMAAGALSQALDRSMPLPELLKGAFLAQGGEVAEAMLTSPHGMELLDAGSSAAADLIREGEGRLSVIYALWLTRAADLGKVRFDGSAEEVALAITTALKGIKCVVPDYATYRARLTALAQLVGQGLTPR